MASAAMILLPDAGSFRRRRVLVIDDVPHNRAMLVDFLNLAGFESETAEDGLQGIDKVRSFQPDLILMDSVMPVMSGPEATRLLRADPAHAHLPIIALSANAAQAHCQECLHAGANMCLTKPVLLHRLAAAIEQLLEAASARHGRACRRTNEPQAEHERLGLIAPRSETVRALPG